MTPPQELARHIRPPGATRSTALLALCVVMLLSVGALLYSARANAVRSGSLHLMPDPITVAPLDPPSPASPVSFTEQEAASSEPGLPPAYIGSVRVMGRVLLTDDTPVQDAEVLSTPTGFQPHHTIEFGTFTTRTDAAGCFTLPAAPAAPAYAMYAYTSSHYCEDTVMDARATDGTLVLRARGIYYTRHEFFDDRGEPVRLPREARDPLLGPVIASTHSASPDLSRQWILRRMGIDLPTSTNTIAVVFAEPSPSAGAIGTITLPFCEPACIGLERRPLSQWPLTDRVVVQRATRTVVTLFDVAIPPRRWPQAWGADDPSLDFRIYFVTADNIWRSVNRRVPAFVLPTGTTFTLYDQTHRELAYETKVDGHCVSVMPAYPCYGMLEVTYAPPSDAAQPYQVVLRPADDPGWPVVGSSTTPGTAYFGPLPTGDYQATLERGFSTSALECVRVLGRITVEEGLNVRRCQ